MKTFSPTNQTWPKSHSTREGIPGRQREVDWFHRRERREGKIIVALRLPFSSRSCPVSFRLWSGSRAAGVGELKPPVTTTPPPLSRLGFSTHHLLVGCSFDVRRGISSLALASTRLIKLEGRLLCPRKKNTARSVFWVIGVDVLLLALNLDTRTNGFLPVC